MDCCVCIFGFVLTLSLSSLAEDQVGGAAAGREEGREKKKKKNSRDRRRARFFVLFQKELMARAYFFSRPQVQLIFVPPLSHPSNPGTQLAHTHTQTAV
jgi:hypothetical protein